MTASDIEQQTVVREQFPAILQSALVNLKTVSACGNAKGERHRFYEYSSIQSCCECLTILEEIRQILPVLESELKTTHRTVGRKSSALRNSP
jgi:hypothetical protein